MSQHNLPELLSDFNRYFTSSNGVDVPARVSVPRDEWRALFAALSEQGAGEAVAGKWDGAEEWMPLAWELCADECGEESCTELVWEGGPIPEPWGDRWLKYEDEAKRLIALVRKHTRPQVAQPPLKATETMIDAAIANADKFSGKGWRATYAGIYEAMAEAAQPARVVDAFDVLLTDEVIEAATLAHEESNCHDLIGPMSDAMKAAVACARKLSTPPAAPTGGRQESSIHAGCSPIHRSQVAAPSQQADHSPDGGNMVEQQAGEVTELRAALWHIKNTAISLSDAQVIALEALAAFEAKKAGA